MGDLNGPRPSHRDPEVVAPSMDELVHLGIASPMSSRKGRRPRLWVIAGPNGAGKTTFARSFLPRYARCREFVNADLIAGGLSPFAPGAAAVEAGRLVLKRVRELSRRREDFAIETTLAGRGYLRLFARLKAAGYRIHLFYLWLPDAELAIRRVRERVLKGGHTVPEADIRRRFNRGLANLGIRYGALLDSWLLLDNSGSRPAIIAGRRSGALRVENPEVFGLILRAWRGHGA